MICPTANFKLIYLKGHVIYVMKYIITFCVFFLPAYLFSQVQLLNKIPLEKQVAIADAIVEGKVVNKVSYWDVGHKNIYTVHTLEVSKIHKGDSKSEIHLVSLGGTIGLQSHIVRPALKLPVNAVGVFVAKNADIALEGFPSTKPIYKSVGLSQGVYRYNLKKGNVINPFLSFSNHKKLEDTITSLTKREATQIKETNYFETEEVNIKKKSVFGVEKTQINTLSPTEIAAGNGSVLSISGANFGTDLGIVRFQNADDGGATTIEALETNIESWTDTEITIKVPSGAGSGAVEVETSAGVTHTITGLEITHNYITGSYSDATIRDGKEVEYPIHHISDHNANEATSTGNFENGAYLFNYHTDFDSNTAAVSAFESGFDAIVCNAGSKFTISDATTTAKLVDDNINSISFDTTEEGVLGFVLSRTSGYGITNGLTNETSLYFFFYEIDYVFSPDVSWDFNGDATFSEFDFNAVVRHETGHAAGLGHVINSAEIMHYAIGPGPKDAITSEPIYEPVRAKINFDKAVFTPSPITATDFSDCYTLNLISPTDNTIVAAYPNPANESITLTTKLPMHSASIYTLTGKMLQQVPLGNSTSEHLNVSEIPQGHYFIIIQFENKQEVVRFIKSN